VLRDGFSIGGVTALVTSSIGMLACAVIWAEPGLSRLLVVIAGIASGGFRAYTSLRRRYASLERLYGFTRSLASSSNPGDAIELLLSMAAEMLRAEVSEIALFDDGWETGLRSTSAGGNLDTVTVAFDPITSLELRAGATGSALLASRLTKDGDLAQGLAARRFKDALLIPLRRGGTVVGTFLVANRMGHVMTFDGEDLKLFETIGLHGSTTLENDRLMNRLRDEAKSKDFQSLHA
jgi:GAF domain-containing protein